MYGEAQHAADLAASLAFDDRQVAYRAAVERHREFPSADNYAKAGTARCDLAESNNARARLWSNLAEFDPLAAERKARVKRELAIAGRQAPGDPRQAARATELQAELDALKRLAWGLAADEPAAAA